METFLSNVGSELIAGLLATGIVGLFLYLRSLKKDINIIGTRLEKAETNADNVHKELRNSFKMEKIAFGEMSKLIANDLTSVQRKKIIGVISRLTGVKI